MMNPSFLEPSPPPDPRQDASQDSEHPTLAHFVAIDSGHAHQHHQHQQEQQQPQQKQQRAPVASPFTNQSQQQHSSMTTLQPHGIAPAHSTTLMYPQSRWQGHQSHHYLVQAHQPQSSHMQHHSDHAQQQRQQYQQQHTDPQQRHQQPQQHHHHQLAQRGAAQSFSVPRIVSTPAWTSSGASAAMHHYPHPADINTAAASATAVDPSAPSSSSSSGSLLSYWDHSAASDSELAMSSTMTPGDAHRSTSEMPGSAGGVGGVAHHRYTSSAASLPALSPTGMLGGGSHSSSSHMGSAASSHGYMTAGGSDHYQGYAARPASMSLSTQQPYGYPSTHQQASGMTGSLAYPSSVSAPLPSPGLVYGSSSSSSQLSGGGYDAYSQPSFSSQYVSYLPPSLHDSRFYPLNPFEIKHRRRTTKTQFRVLESTFREVPKPNATLRKQISAQLDMPVRAVQIWFQNRRAKAKAMEKKRTGGGGGNISGSSGEVAAAGTSAGVERAKVQSSGMTGSGHLGYNEAGEQRYYDEGLRGGAGATASAGFDHGSNRPTSRSMDLPPLRNVDQLRSGDNYTTTTASSTTAPALPPIESRDRRPPSLASSMTMHPASTLSLASGSASGAPSHATYSDDQAGIPRASVAHTGLPGPAAITGMTNDDTHHTASGSLLAVGGLPSSSARPASRMPSLAPPALPSPSSRSFTEDHPNRFWSSTQQ